MKLARTCPYCGLTALVEVPEEGYDKWVAGALLQHAMPEVLPALREMILTGTCPRCWDKIGFDSE